VTSAREGFGEAQIDADRIGVRPLAAAIVVDLVTTY
jgi:hypothetical protein